MRRGRLVSVGPSSISISRQWRNGAAGASALQCGCSSSARARLKVGWPPGPARAATARAMPPSNSTPAQSNSRSRSKGLRRRCDLARRPTGALAARRGHGVGAPRLEPHAHPLPGGDRRRHADVQGGRVARPRDRRVAHHLRQQGERHRVRPCPGAATEDHPHRVLTGGERIRHGGGERGRRGRLRHRRHRAEVHLRAGGAEMAAVESDGDAPAGGDRRRHAVDLRRLAGVDRQHRPANGERRLRREVGLDQNHRAEVGDGQRIGHLEEDRPQLRQVVVGERQRREAEAVELERQPAAGEVVLGAAGPRQVVGLRKRLRVELRRHGAEEELRHVLPLVAVEGDQVVEVERQLRPADQRAVAAAHRQLGVAQRRVRRHLVEEQVDLPRRRHLHGLLRPRRPHRRPRHRRRHRRLQDVLQRRRHRCDRPVIAHRARRRR
jgi:hypothetical protein